MKSLLDSNQMAITGLWLFDDTHLADISALGEICHLFLEAETVISPDATFEARIKNAPRRPVVLWKAASWQILYTHFNTLKRRTSTSTSFALEKNHIIL